MKKSLPERVCFLTSPLLENLSLDNFSTFFVDAKHNAFCLDLPCSSLERYLKQDFFLQNPFLDPELILEGCFLINCEKGEENESKWGLDPLLIQKKNQASTGYLIHLISDHNINLLVQQFPLMQKFCTELVQRTKKIISVLESAQGIACVYDQFDREFSVLFFNNTNLDLLLKSLDLPHIELSKRERELLRLCLKKETEQSIAERLPLSLERVEKYMRDLKKKLKCDTQLQLFKKAAQLLIWGLL